MSRKAKKPFRDTPSPRVGAGLRARWTAAVIAEGALGQVNNCCSRAFSALNFNNTMFDALIIGAGPSGLAAAEEMTKNGAKVSVLEKLDRPGGLSRTVSHEGCLYDIGPHRFFTKNNEVKQLFKSVVAEDGVTVQRLTRIFSKGHFFYYPLSPFNALRGVGLASALRILASYGTVKMKQWVRPRTPQNFEEWTIDQFGSHLYQIFFKSYTEKVWGIPCTQIGADWAQQRIRGLNLSVVVKNALFKSKSWDSPRTLVDQFLYPRRGAGLFYEKLTRRIEDRGSHVLPLCPVVSIQRDGFRVRSVTTLGPDGKKEFEAKNFMSSAPLTETVQIMNPPAPPQVLAACRSLRYRDHIGVDLKLRGVPFPDNWIYVHSKDVRMARISNYRNFSPDMADRPDVSPVTVEYFTFQNDEIWNRSDDDLIKLATQELEQMKIIKAGQVIAGFVMRNTKAYPVIEIGFQEHINVIKAWLDQFENFQCIGRSGMFKYNNQDHAIMTGLLAARTAMGVGRYDPWLVNNEAEYLENAPAN